MHLLAFNYAVLHFTLLQLQFTKKMKISSFTHLHAIESRVKFLCLQNTKNGVVIYTIFLAELFERMLAVKILLLQLCNAALLKE